MHTVELSGGTIHYAVAGPSNARPVVVVHGYAMGGSLWRPLSERLARQGLRCIAPTWPLGGHTEAMRPTATLTMRGVAAMVDEFLTALDGRVTQIIRNAPVTAAPPVEEPAPETETEDKG